MVESIKSKAIELVLVFGPRLLVAIVTLVIGFAIINKMIKTFDRTLQRHRIDESLHSFIKAAASFMLKGVIVIIAAGIMDIPSAPFIAMLSAAGLAIALGLKESLANFSGGILILIFRPFNVGDFIDLDGYMGTVKEIQLLYTLLNTTDNKRITIPNSQLANGKVINFSAESTRRIDLTFGVSYDDDIQKVKGVLTQIVNDHPLIFKDPEPLVRPNNYGDNTIDFTVRVWCASENYWSIYYDLHETVKDKFDAEGITIPFVQQDINIYEKEIISRK